MTSPTRDGTRAHRRRRRARTDGKPGLAWRLAVPVAFACAGLLATTSMVNARGTDLRGGRSADLVDIVAAQSAEAQQLSERIEAVQGDIAELTSSVGGARLAGIQRQIDAMSVSAGLTGLTGPGLEVSLDDAPLDQELPDGFDTNRLLVHQEDIQAVVNAMWAGGAEGISLMGQRIISTTGIKCVGNSVLLQGVPYSPPYELVAVGNAVDMYDALVTSPEVLAYRSDAEEYDLGWQLSRGDDLMLPAFSGTPELVFARAGASPAD